DDATGICSHKLVRDSPTGAQDCLRINLVRHTDPRTDSVRIGRLVERAITRRSIPGRSRMPASIGIRRGRIKLALSAVLLMIRSGVVPTNTVIQGQFAGDLPRIL